MRRSRVLGSRLVDTRGFTKRRRSPWRDSQRGFAGRLHGERDPRLPPGQYDTGTSWPVLTAEVTPKLDTATWTFAIEGSSTSRRRGRGTRSTRCPPSTYDGDIHCVTTWSKLGMHFGGRFGRHVAASRRRRCRPRRTCWRSRTPATRRTSRWPTSPAGKAWVVWEVDGAPLPVAARRAGAAARAAPLLLEEREVGGRTARCSTTTSRASGSATATTTAATRGSSSATRATDAMTRDADRWQTATRGRRSDRRPTRAKTFRLALAQPVGTPRRPALRRAPHRARRLHRVAVVLGRVGRPTARTRSSSPSSGSRTARSRPSCTTRSWSATSSRCGDRSADGSCGTATAGRCSSAAAPASCRSWPCCGSHGGPIDPIWCGSSCRRAHPATCTTPTS